MALSSPLFTQEREDAASRRQDFYSLDEGLSSSQSSSVGHVRTGRLVLGSLIPNVRETPRRDFENEQIDSSGTTERADPRWLSSIDSKTRDPGRLWQKYPEVESRTSWSSCEKSLWDGRIEAISRICIWYNFKKKIDRRSRYYPWIYRQDSGITKWNSLYELFEIFSRCWISTQWTIPRYQSTSVFPTSSRSWWNAKPFYGNAEPQQWAAKHLGHTLYIGKCFCKSNDVLFSILSARVKSLGLQCIRHTHHHMWWVNAKHQFRIRDASQDRQPEIQSSLVREDFQIIMVQTNNCRFQILILTNSPHQQRSLVGR